MEGEARENGSFNMADADEESKRGGGKFEVEDHLGLRVNSERVWPRVFRGGYSGREGGRGSDDVILIAASRSTSLREKKGVGRVIRSGALGNVVTGGSVLRPIVPTNQTVSA
jgi:hypothetical protein